VLGELQSQREKLFELTQHSIDAQERERLYLASEIHDELLQGLVAVLYFLQMLDVRSLDARTRKKRTTLTTIIKSSIDRARSLISEVEPIRDPDIGLIQAIKKSIKNRLGTAVKVRFTYPKKLPRIAFAQKANILRIIQEALTNVRKHSKATRLLLKIATHDDKLEVSLKDNGVGFDVNRALKRGPGHFGLVSIQERAQLVGGQLTVTSAPGKGTRIHGMFPLKTESR
jgi:signal transduction histidine kinase